MPNLFPDGSLDSVTLKKKNPIIFKGSYAFDFEKGEFIKNPDGTIKKLAPLEAYIQWCQKTMLTARFKYLAYSSQYGQELRSIVGSDLDNKAIELEIKRIVKEALMVHPLTNSVENFEFKWENGELYYDYEVITIKQQRKFLSSKLKVR